MCRKLCNPRCLREGRTLALNSSGSCGPEDGLEGLPAHPHHPRVTTTGRSGSEHLPPAMRSQLISKTSVFGSKATPALLFDYMLCIIPIVKP